mgnify:CR=1 FL=1
MAQNTPAVLGPVESSVRPRAFMSEDGNRLAHHQHRDYTVPLYDQAALDAARMSGVHSVHEQTAVIVRAALELLESIEGNEPFTAEKMRAFKRVFGS